MKNAVLTFIQLIISGICIAQTDSMRIELKEQIKLYSINGYNDCIEKYLKLTNGRVTSFEFTNYNYVFHEKIDSINLSKNIYTEDLDLYFSYQLFHHFKPLRLILVQRGVICTINDKRDFNIFVTRFKEPITIEKKAILYLLLTEKCFHWRKIIFNEKYFEIFSGQEETNKISFKSFCIEPHSLSHYKKYATIKNKLTPVFNKKRCYICIVDQNGDIIQISFKFRKNNLSKIKEKRLANLNER
jgi:hypothetical protein